MRRLTIPAIAAGIGLMLAACSSKPMPSLQAAADTLGASNVKSIEFSGTGRWFQFGQAPAPTLPWPQFDATSFTSLIDYDTASARVQMTRKQAVEPGRARPAPVEQRPDQFVSGAFAWNMAPAAGAAAGAAAVPQPQPAAVEERAAEIWATPHGFLKAALANNATSEQSGGNLQITFTSGKNRYIGTINPALQVERVHTWIDNPVLGDTLVETTFADYRDFGGVMFPGHIIRNQGGHPVLDITVSAVKTNPGAAIAVPDAVRAFTPPPVTVTVQKLADGVYYMTGGTHHSVAIDQRDHIVVVEGPLNEARSQAVIAKVKETIPNKPIRFLINTHAHFDHSGGLRTYVDEGATIVTHEENREYYEQAWKAPHTLGPDRLAQSGKSAMFDTFTDKKVVTDGRRSIEIYPIAGSGHNDAFAMVYLPAEHILIEADAFTPGAANAPPPATPSPFTVNLAENVQRLKLDVRQIAALHGPRVTTMADLRAAAGQTAGTN